MNSSSNKTDKVKFFNTNFFDINSKTKKSKMFVMFVAMFSDFGLFWLIKL